MKRITLAAVVSLICLPGAFAQKIANYEFGVGAVGTRASVDAEINSTASDFEDGQGLAGGTTFDLVNGNPVPSVSVEAGVTGQEASDALADADYFEFTVTPDPGFQFNLDSLVFDYAVSGEGQFEATFFARSNLDGFTTNIVEVSTGPSGTFAMASGDLSAPLYQNVTAPIMFRIYLFDSNNGEVNFDLIDNVMLLGTVTPIPEPSTYAMLLSGAALLGLAVWRRRRHALGS